MTPEQHRAEFVTLLAAMLHSQTPQTLTNAKTIDDVLNTVAAVQAQMDAFLKRGTEPSE